MRLLLNWLISAISLLIVAHVIKGFNVSSFQSALIAAVAIGLVNSTLGLVLKFLSFPWIILTLGVASLVINALMLMLAAYFVDGFSVDGFIPAFIGSILMSISNFILRLLAPDLSKKKEAGK
ncbi:MAG: phage holin family protein [Acidobacteria bacterium]|nr:phage holin family protein [Acidobacteriota bacterium]